MKLQQKLNKNYEVFKGGKAHRKEGGRKESAWKKQGRKVKTKFRLSGGTGAFAIPEIRKKTRNIILLRDWGSEKTKWKGRRRKSTKAVTPILATATLHENPARKRKGENTCRIVQETKETARGPGGQREAARAATKRPATD